MSLRARLLFVGIVAAALILVGVFGVDWFTVKTGSATLQSAMIDLRGVHVCMAAGPCVDVSMSHVPGSFPFVSTVAFWTSLAFAALLAYQVAAKHITRAASDTLTRVAAGAGVIAFFAAVFAAYVLAPDPTLETSLGTVTIARHAGPMTLLVGIALGLYALALLSREDELEPAPAAPMRTNVIAPLPAAHSSARPGRVTASQPQSLERTLRCAAATLDLTEGGLDTRFADGNLGMVAWEDIVGVVARQLPARAPYDGADFVDIISGPHATVRVLPSTRITSEPAIAGAGVDRVRSLIAVIRTYKADAKLDAATRSFCDDNAPLRQLTDEAELAAHDERLP